MLNWISKRHASGAWDRTALRRKDEVRISMNKSTRTKDGKARSLSIRFGEDAHKLITIQGYIVIALDEATRRIYFKEADAHTGFKLTTNTKGNARVKHVLITLSEDDIPMFSNYVGRYIIEYDDGNKLYYVAYANKLETGG